MRTQFHDQGYYPHGKPGESWNGKFLDDGIEEFIINSCWTWDDTCGNHVPWISDPTNCETTCMPVSCNNGRRQHWGHYPVEVQRALQGRCLS